MLYGGAAGLSATGSIHLRQGNGLKGVAEADDLLGRSLVAGRFRSGPYWDLVIGVPGEDVAGVNSAGAIHLVRGSASGLRTNASDTLWHQDSPGLLGWIAEHDNWGRTLAVGRLNGDDYDDLAVGAPHSTVGGKSNGGAVQVIYSESGGGGLHTNGNRVFTQNEPGVADEAEDDEQFGHTLAATRTSTDWDTYRHLIIGIEAESFDETAWGGVMKTCCAIHMLRGGASGVTTVGQALLHGGSSASLTSADLSDWFSRSLAAR